MRRNMQWWQQNAKRQRDEMKALLQSSADSRRAAAKVFPNLAQGTTTRPAPARQQQATPRPSIAAAIYPHLPRSTE